MSLARSFLALGLAILCAPASSLALTPEERCQSTKNNLAGKHAQCRQKEVARAIRRGTVPDFSKCEQKLQAKWAKAQQKALAQGGACVDLIVADNMIDFLTYRSDRVDLALAPGGGVLYGCGDGVIEGPGEDCEGTNLSGQDCNSLGFAGGTLGCSSTCVFDTVLCTGTAPFVCGDNAVNVIGEQCDGGDLAGEDCTSLGFSGGTLACDASCKFETNGCDHPACPYPASGETVSYGPGSDGHDPAGALLAFVDNGDGTITDSNTGLMWEKKDDSGGIHDQHNTYTWSGTLGTVFLDTLNDVGGGGASCFAGHCDWRVPNLKELISITDLSTSWPVVGPAFHQPTCSGCSDVTLASCSCTSTSSRYWSSTTVAGTPDRALVLQFFNGRAETADKSFASHVRAVRGGY